MERDVLLAGSVDVGELEPALDVGVECVEEGGQLGHCVLYLAGSTKHGNFSFPCRLLVVVSIFFRREQRIGLTPLAGSARKREL